MYIEGIVTEINGYKAKIKVPEFDDMVTEFLSVPQLFTVNNKSGFKIEVGALVGAVLSDDMTYGAILGEIYNDEDTPPAEQENTEFITFSDGVSISHVPGTKTLEINADDIIVNSNIICSKNITCAETITCSVINDSKGSMENFRQDYNVHKHPNGNNGDDTGVPKTLL